MRWFKREMWKIGIIITGILLFLVFISSVVHVYAVAPLPTTSTAVIAQATPTEDATVTALNKEKLEQEVEQLKAQNEPSLFEWLRANITTLLVIGGGLFGLVRYLAERRDSQERRAKDQADERDKRAEEQKRLLDDRQAERDKRAEEQKRLLDDRQAERDKRAEEQKRWLKDQADERDKRAEERFQSAVTGLCDEKEGARIGAAVLLRTFLRPEHEQFYRQVFDLTVAHLRLLANTHQEDSDAPVSLTTLSQALIMVFKEAFPLARDQATKQPQSLDATGVQLDTAYLSEADLKQVWMPHASLRKADLILANLREANLNRADLRDADLSGAHLTKANLGRANLSGADLRDAKLIEATFSGANLTTAQLPNADLTGAWLSSANLQSAYLWNANLQSAYLWEADLTHADLDKADLTHADLREANLTGVDLECVYSLKDTNLYGAKGLTKELLEACRAKGAVFIDPYLH